MLFDAPDPGHVLGGHAQRFALCFGTAIRQPEMHDAVLDNDVFRPSSTPSCPLSSARRLATCPWLRFGLGRGGFLVDAVFVAAREALPFPAKTRFGRRHQQIIV